VINFGVSETIEYQDTQEIKRVVTTEETAQISLDYAPSQNNVEVFVGGNRLRKVSKTSYDITQDYPYSPEGDVIETAQFVADDSSNVINFTESIPAYREILVVKRQGMIWEDDANTDLVDSNTAQAKFILQAEPFYPEYSR
jgi:hypothetical protein